MTGLRRAELPKASHTRESQGITVELRNARPPRPPDAEVPGVGVSGPGDSDATRVRPLGQITCDRLHNGCSHPQAPEFLTVSIALTPGCRPSLLIQGSIATVPLSPFWTPFADVAGKGSLSQNEEARGCCVPGDAGVPWRSWLRQNLETPRWGSLTCHFSLNPRGGSAVIFSTNFPSHKVL